MMMMIVVLTNSDTYVDDDDDDDDNDYDDDVNIHCGGRQSKQLGALICWHNAQCAYCKVEIPPGC